MEEIEITKRLAKHLFPSPKKLAKHLFPSPLGEGGTQCRMRSSHHSSLITHHSSLITHYHVQNI
jgi:hypothetical protein